MMRGQARSGLSIRVWCREHDLHEQAFYWWRSRLAQTDRRQKPRYRKPALVPVRVSAPEADRAEGGIEIVLPGDRRVRVKGRVDRQTLVDVLAVLEAPPC
jgi:transposase-like protein